MYYTNTNDYHIDCNYHKNYKLLNLMNLAPLKEITVISILLPSTCLGIATAGFVDLLKPIPKYWQLFIATLLCCLAMTLFEYIHGWWWAVPYFCFEIMAFSFVWLISGRLWPKFSRVLLAVVFGTLLVSVIGTLL